MRAMLFSPSIYVDLLVSDHLATRLRRVANVLAFGLACVASLPSHAMVELTGISKISAGYSHTCALTTAGGAKCWGDNSFGQLGDNTVTRRLTPVDVSGLASGVAAITAGRSHTCALTTTGGAKCWGFNGDGALGDNSTTDRSTPGDVSGLASGVAAIAAGDYHTCALTTAGGVKCWGNNSDGQLGDGSTTRGLTPVNVSGFASGAAAITVGYGDSCALTTAGAVKCWGDNRYGQLGDNTTTDSWTPVDVSGLASGVDAIAAGPYHTCALTTAGGVKCWGPNAFGELGDNTTTRRLTPVDVSGLASGAAAVTAGLFHTCALTTAGEVKCWGNNRYGQLGDGTAGVRLFPAPVLTFYATGTPSGGNSSLSLLANFNIASADIGRTGSFYIAALLPTGELLFLTPSGFIQYAGGPIPTYSTDTLSNRSITVLSDVNVTPFLGTMLFAGYGLNDADLIANSKYDTIHTVQ